MIQGRDNDRKGCPAPETVAAFVAGALSAAERDVIFEHLYECAACQEEFAVLGAVTAEQEEEGFSPVPRELPLRARELLPPAEKNKYVLLGEIIVSFSEKAIESLLTNISVLAGPDRAAFCAVRSGNGDDKKISTVVAEKERRQGNIRIAVSREDGTKNSVSVQVLTEKNKTSYRISLCDKSDVLESCKVSAQTAFFNGILPGSYLIKIEEGAAEPVYIYLELDPQT